jgi:hypothetical protein
MDAFKTDFFAIFFEDKINLGLVALVVDVSGIGRSDVVDLAV